MWLKNHSKHSPKARKQDRGSHRRQGAGEALQRRPLAIFFEADLPSRADLAQRHGLVAVLQFLHRALLPGDVGMAGITTL